jgi:glycosyltransferase involved in cell wall biosynthesis
MLIALPRGLGVSGVATWAVRLANGLVARGRRAGLLLHAEAAGDPRVEIEIDPRVLVTHVPGPPIDSCGGDLSAYMASYRRAVEQLSRGGLPGVLTPNLHGDCYGVAAALIQVMPEQVRVVGWQHSDIEYDARVLSHYAAGLVRFVGVSEAIATSLRQRLGTRSGDVVEIPYGVEVGPARTRRPDGPLRLVYTGRLEEPQKRAGSLVHLSDELHRRDVRHVLTIAGSGPLRPELERAVAAGRAERMCVVGALGPARVAALLRESDIFVLPSRYEGLSVSVLEAMAAGCVPVVARTRSGAGQAIADGRNGVLADLPAEADAGMVGAVLAEAVQRAVAMGLGELGERARTTVAERFSLAAHLDRVEALIDASADRPARRWPATRACAFTGSGPGGSGSVPPEGARLLAEALARVSGRHIIIHGAGQHTLQLASVFADAPARIVALSDDDPQKHGRMLWNWPIIAPAHAGRTGATDVVISSWMHETTIWQRRAVYERQGLRVQRVYAEHSD